ncbi:hypothetical protein ONZ45_g17497 [Pleurotus djamor]|nr:hypothetical protein ONZ45_g17497 [Pleurotus djamor]
MTPPPTPPHEKRTAMLPHHFSESPVDSDPSMQHPPQTSRSDTSLSSSSSGSGSGRDAPSHPVTPLDPPADIVSKAKYSRAQNLTHMPHHQHFDPSMHLDESGLPAIRSFNVRRASAQCKQLQGYVSFGDVEGLGGPPSPSPHEDCFNVDGKGNGDNRKKFGWFGW